MNIDTVKFVTNVQVGMDANPMTYLHNNSVHSDFKITITLDDDERFLLLTSTPLTAGRKPFYQLVPLSAVSTILIGPRHGVVNTTAQSKKS